MPDLINNIINGRAGVSSRWSKWTAYVATLILEIVLTIGLILLRPYFPLAKFPVPYILLMMAVAYLFGEGPAILAFFVGLFAFTFFFVYPTHFHWPPGLTMEGWTRLTAFFLGTLVVGLATAMIRRSKLRNERLARELEYQQFLQQKEKALLDTFMQHVPVGLAFHDRETRHLIVNRTLAEMSGTTLEKMLGHTVDEVLPPQLAAHVRKSIEEAFSTGKPSKHEEYSYRDRYFNSEHLPVKSPDGEIIGVGAVVVDITDQVIAKRSLEAGYEREHKIAEAFENTLLGTVPDRIGCFNFEAVYQAAMEEAGVGGDFYDAFDLGENKVAIVVGDVSGKGLKAAVQVAMAKYSIRSRAYGCSDPAEVLTQVNDVIIQDTDEESFVTIFLGILNCKERTLTYANGGHAPVMLWSNATKDAKLIGPTGPIVGVQKNAKFEGKTLTFEPGDEVFLTTDGLIAIKDSTGFIDIDDLLSVYTTSKRDPEHSAASMVQRMVRQSDIPVRDDIAVLRVWAAN